MLLIYGPYMPLRLLEEITFWKLQEKEHTVVIREIAPNLEPPYVELLKSWEPVFDQTERSAHRLLGTALAAPQAVPPAVAAQTNALLHVAAYQSRTFVAQLNKLTGVSRAIAGSPVAVTVVRHIIRESEYFLCVLATLLEPRETPEFDAGSHAASQYGAVAGELPETGRPQGANNGPAGNLPHGGAPYAGGTPQHAAHGGDPYAGVPGGFGSPAFDAPDTAGMPRDANNQRLEADRKHITSASVPIGGHALPPLPYPYDALEPHIDKETMRIHHDKHHQSYVDGLNKAEKELEKARQTGDYALVKHWERELAFNGAGHYLHTLFWNVMSPHGGGTASGAMARQIAQDFGSFEAFRNHFSNAAEKVEGGGWAILVWSPRSRRLEILTAEKHQNLSQWDAVPVLPLDVWEHAYYLKHQNKRADYIQAWWNVVNWPYVNQRFTEASRLVWPPY